MDTYLKPSYVLDEDYAMPTTLKSRWLSLFNDLTHTERLESVYSEIVLHYSEKKRYYHTTMHLVEMLDKIDEMLNIYHIESHSADKNSLYFASFFHDVVQFPENSFDGYTVVESSAEFAVNAMKASGIDNLHLINSVHELITLTSTHKIDSTLHTDELTQKIFLDSDLAILGSDWDRYRQYATDIALEYSDMSEKEFRAGRTNFLTNMVHRERIFSTDYMHELYGEQAKLNIKKELDFLYSLNAQDLIDDTNGEYAP